MIRWPVKLRIVYKPNEDFKWSLQRKFLWWWFEVDYDVSKYWLEDDLKCYMKRKNIKQVVVEDTTVTEYRLVNGKVTVAS